MERNESAVVKEQVGRAQIIHLYVEEETKHTQKKRYHLKNSILATVTIIAFLLIVNCVAAWENNVPNMVPYVIQAILGATWIRVFSYANKEELLYQYDDDEEEEDDYFDERG